MISEYYFFLFIYIMAKHRSHKRKSHSKKSRTMYQQGGELAGNPASAWGWGLGTVGNGWTQFMNTFSTANPSGNANSNGIVANSNNILKLKGGRRHKKSKSRKH
jgi:hypothetical protein